MIVIEDKNTCTGCGACAAACPAACIAMTPDEEGFAYALADAQRCTGCGLCDRLCPLRAPAAGPGGPPEAYAAWARDAAVRAQSSSGGVFTVLARQVLGRGGAVFGAAAQGDAVAHVCARTEADLAALRGSKNVQSDTGDSFQQAKALLDEGKPVLYTGTPCQIAGLRAYLRRPYDGLVCADILCHGVPSPRVFRAWLRHTGGGAGAQHVRFRDKSKGWKRYRIALRRPDGSEYAVPRRKDPYFVGFMDNLYLRPACHSCPWASTTRVGDVTLGDFWGVARRHPGWDDDGGTSLVLANTQKGAALLQACAGELILHHCDLADALPGNPPLTQPSPPSPQREAFWRDFERMSFDDLARVYMKPRKDKSLPRRVASRLLYAVRRWLAAGK